MKRGGKGSYKAFEESVASCGATWHHGPGMFLKVVELQGFDHFLGFHGCGIVSLIREWGAGKV